MTTEIEKLQQDLSQLHKDLATKPDDPAQTTELVQALLHKLGDTHEKIEQAHQEWMAALDVVDSPIFLHDRDFRIMRCNLSYQRCAGRPFHQIIGRPYYSVFPERPGPLNSCQGESEQLVDAIDEEFMVGDAVYTSHVRTVTNSNGEYLFSVHLLSDISQRKKAENLLRESQARYKRITDCVTDYLYSVRVENGRATETRQSAACEKVTGFTSPEFESNPNLWLQMVAPEDREMVLYRVSQILSGIEVPPIEHRIVRKDGTLRWVRDTIILLKDTEGRLLSYDGVISDVTEKKNAEIAIMRANRAYKVLSAVNHAVVRAVDESSLLHSICNIIVKAGGYSAAWVGFKQHGTHCGLQPIAYNGLSDQEVGCLNASCDERSHDNGPICKVLRSGEIQIVQDISSIHGNDTWHGYAMTHDHKTTIMLPLIDGDDVFGCLSVYDQRINSITYEELSLLDEMSDDLSFGIIRLRLLEAKKSSEEKVLRSLLGTLQAIATMQEMRDPYTSGHQRRVADLSVAIATELELPYETIRGLSLAATVHDLGKIQTPVEILNKPGDLTASEFAIIKEHPQHGYEVLKDVDLPWPVAQIVLQHHEKLDGTGYPQGMQGEEILLETRILTVADVVESMTSHRPYRPSLGIEAALREITQCRGTSYDAKVVDACVKLFLEKNYKFPGIWHRNDD